MRGKRHQKLILKVLVAASSLCLSSAVVQGQEGRRLAPSSTPSSETAGEVRALSELIHELQAQVQVLNSQLSDLRAEEKQMSEEARGLRRELDLARTQTVPATYGS